MTTKDVEFIGDATYGALKFSNGALICFRRLSVNVTFDENGKIGSLYRCVLQNSPFGSFKVPFVAPPTVSFATADQDDYSFCFPYASRRDSNSIMRLDLLRPNATSGSATIHYTAIGRWK